MSATARILSACAGAFVSAMLLAACAAPRPIEKFEYYFDDSRGRFEPTRVTINRNVPVSPRYFDRLDSVVRALAQSGAFVAFGDDVPSSMVLDLTLERLSDDSFSSVSAGGGGARGGVGVSMPVSVTGGRHTHRLTAVVYRDGESTHAYRYVGDFDTAWSIRGPDSLDPQGPEATLISNLVNRLIRDLEADDAIARSAP